MTETDLYADVRVRKHVLKKYKELLKQFGTSIDKQFNSSIENYINCRKLFATLEHKAVVGKGKALSEKELIQFMKFKHLFRNIGEMPKRFFNFKIKHEGKSIRVSKTVLQSLLQQFGFKFINHGKNYKTNEHWSNFFIPKFNKIKELYKTYKDTTFDETKKDTTMTKTEKENLRIECEKGLHGLPYEVLVKDAERKERREELRKQKRIAKVSEQTYIKMQARITELEQELKAAKAEIEHLKTLKDLNSDIPEDDDGYEHKLSYDEFLSKYPDGIDPDTFDYSELSDECIARLDVEAKEDKAKFEAVDTDDESATQQLLAAQNLIKSEELSSSSYSDIPEDDEQQKHLINQDSLQEQIFHQRISPTFAKKLWKIISRSDVDFKESRTGWSATIEQSKTQKYRKFIVDMCIKEYSNLDCDDIIALQKLI